MSEIMTAILFLGLPMLIAYFAYRFFDRDGKKVKKLIGKFPFIQKHRFIVLIGGMVAFVIIFGLISIAAGFPQEVFYVVSGLVLGLANGVSATMMYNE